MKKEITQFNRKELEEAIVQNTSNKRWIYSPKIKVMKGKFLKEIYEMLQEVDNDERRIKEAERRRENRISELIEQRKALT